VYNVVIVLHVCYKYWKQNPKNTGHYSQMVAITRWYLARFDCKPGMATYGLRATSAHISFESLNLHFWHKFGYRDTN